MAAYDSSLAGKAFGENADSGLVVAYQSHQDALRFLSSAMGQANGIALLQGPAGSGKSTIVKEQLDWSSHEVATAYVEGVHLTPRELLNGMLTQFGLETGSQQDEQLLQQLNNFMAGQTRDGKPPILVIDDADRASASALRLLEWLAALDAGDVHVLRIILTGTDRLAALMRHTSMRSLARRHPATYSLNPLTAQETMIYLRTRFIAAGGERSEKVFPVEVCNQLRELSCGWPGALNKYAIDVIERMSELRSARSVPRIIVTCNGKTVAEYELDQRQHVIGRGDLADIVIDDNYVSKMHAMLQVYSNALVLLDLNSTNGTLVNSVETPKTILRSNDIIALGRHRLKIENAPAISAEVDEQIKAADTMILRDLADIRRSRAKRTISALKHR